MKTYKKNLIVQMNSNVQKYCSILVGLIIAFAVSSQFYTLFHEKGFWLDEWFVLYNIKFRNYRELFGNLFYIQQIPRVYLSLLKFFIEFFNYSYFSIRFIPTLIQVINILLITIVSSRILFKNQMNKKYLFILLFLSYHSTLFYFSQIKQYSMEIFWTILCVIAFSYLTKNYIYLKGKVLPFAGLVLLFLIGPLFSYSFPVVASPLILFLFFTILDKSNKSASAKKAYLLIAAFLIGITISWFTDLQFVLFDRQQYGNFSKNIMAYNSWKGLANGFYNIIWLFNSIFFFDKSYPLIIMTFLYILKLLTMVSIIYGIFLSGQRLLKNRKMFSLRNSALSFNQRPEAYIYFLAILVVTIGLYFLKLLPIGYHRLSYFCVLPLSYFFINGLYGISDKIHKLKPAFLLAAFFIATFPAVRSSVNEFRNKNLNFDQAIYENVGNAIKAANKFTLPIVVKNNEFYPESIMKNEETLIIKTHHLYKPDKHPKIYQIDAANKDSDSIPERAYILLHKKSFDIIRN